MTKLTLKSPISDQRHEVDNRLSTHAAGKSPADDALSIARSVDGSVDVQKEIKYGKPLRAIWGLFADYSLNSTVHGVRYVFEHRRHWTERLWWVFAFLLSVYGCGRLIINVYVKWDQSPVIVSFAEKSTPVWEIPFPAVTICPETKANTSMLNFTEMYHMFRDGRGNETSELDFHRMMAVLQVCDAHLTDNWSLKEDKTTNVIRLLREMAPSFHDTMFHCKFRNQFQECDKLFKEVMTEEGLCFTFNVLNSQEMYRDIISDDFLVDNHNLTADNWTMEEGYANDPTQTIDPNRFPYRVFGPGARVGMFVVLFLFKQHIEYICRGPVQGFKVLLHTPGEVPQVSKHYFRIPLEQEVLVAVKPNMITTSEGLRHYAPNRRQCYFNSERDLKFFRVYTQRNCELECLTNYTMATCGCVKFGMPREQNTPVCGASKIECFNNAENELQKKHFVEGLSGSTSEISCNCLPACTSITYDAEISQAAFDWEELFNAFKSPLNEFPGMIPSRLSIFFKEKQFITSRRSELYGPTDFLANCGGLLGLFMGVSILSIVELFYYCTLRLCCNLRARKNRKHRKQDNNEEAGGVRGRSVSTIRRAKNDDEQDEKETSTSNGGMPIIMVDKPRIE